MMTFRLTDLAEPLKVRGGPSMKVLRPMVNRYLWLLERARTNFHFTEVEGLTICYTLKGYRDMENRMVPHIGSIVLDECGKGVGERFGVSCDALVTKLYELDEVGKLAVLDSVEVFWALQEGDDAERLRRCGLVREG